MTIQWYPGHMNKARAAIAEALPTKDVVLEVLDARMPRASANPVLGELCAHKACIKILSKSDLADPEITKAWIRALETASANGKVVAVALTTARPDEMRAKIPELCKRLAPNRTGPGKSVRAMVVGIPNVGKSTLINTLMGRKVAKVGDEPAVTKSQQLVTLKSGMTLSDNPGILWPRSDIDSAATMRLALGGAVPDTVMDYEQVALFAAEFFLARYPQLLRVRFKLEEIPASPIDALRAIGRKRGCIRGGGIVDLHKAGDVLVHEFRNGTLGRISLEAPSDPPDGG